MEVFARLEGYYVEKTRPEVDIFQFGWYFETFVRLIRGHSTYIIYFQDITYKLIQKDYHFGFS